MQNNNLQLLVISRSHLLGVRFGCSKMRVALDSRLAFDVGDITVRCFFSKVREISWKLYVILIHSISFTQTIL